MPANKERIDDPWRMPEELWERLEPLLPPRKRRKKNPGRKPLPYRQVVDGVFYVLRTGCQGKAAPAEFGSGSSLHRYFQAWVRRGLFEKLWEELLWEYDELKGIPWAWQSMDGTMTKAPLGGKKIGKNPTDRGKLGVKRSLQVDRAGAPLGVAVAGANRHDMKLVEATLNSMPTGRPDPEQVKQNLCRDKGYDYPEVEELVKEWGYTPHIPKRGQKARLKKQVPGYRARRWLSERTHSWMNRIRRLLIRWEKKPENYLALVHLTCAYITARIAGILGFALRVTPTTTTRIAPGIRVGEVAPNWRTLRVLGLTAKLSRKGVRRGQESATPEASSLG